MQIKKMFEKQIDRDIKGVIKVGQSDEENIYQELDEYVVTKELLKHFRDFFENYENGINGYTDKMGVWISGFFGSGKSHFLKILSYLLKNSVVEGKRAIEYFTDGKKIEDPMLIAKMTNSGTISSDVMLFNIDSKGSAKVGSGKEAIVEVFMKVFNEMQGYCGSIPYLAEFERQLDGEGRFEEFKEKFEQIAGAPWEKKRQAFAVIQDKVVEKCGQMAKKNGYQAMITQHAWMFLSSFEKLRVKILETDIVNMVHLGARAFEEIGGEVVQTTSFVVRKSHIADYKGKYCRLIDPVSQQGKEEMFFTGENRYIADQTNFSKIPTMPIGYWISNQIFKALSGTLASDFADFCKGMDTGDNNRFLRLWFEINRERMNYPQKWVPYNKGGSYRKWYGNNEYVVNWDMDGMEVVNFKGSNIRNKRFYLKPGITWSATASGPFSCRYCFGNYIFDSKGCMAFASDNNRLRYLMGAMNTKPFSKFMQVVSPTLDYNPGPVSRGAVIFEEGHDDIYIEVDENIIISKADWDAFEISWDFQHHPFLRKVFTIVEAFDQWQAECDERFNKLKANEEELNRIFIDIYGLQDELTPDVADKDVTVRKADLGRDIRSFISYAVGCMFGRYSLDKDGLMVAGQPFESVYFEATAPRAGTGVAGATGDYLPTGEFYIKTEDGTKQCTYNPDRDNIIPITDEEYFSDDIVGRFVEFVEMVYGKDTLEENLDFIAQALGNKGNSSREVIRNYFIKDFYKDHLKVYQKRPIYWLFDSGKQNGFKALIYMHRYDADTVGRVRTDYLHRAQNYVETAMKSAEYTIENTSVASEKSKAMKAVSKYTKQLAEMQTYDQAIAHVANQRIEIDLDDGVKVNYAKFQGVEVAQEGKKALKVDLLAKI